MIYMSFEYKDWYKKSEEPKHEMEYGVLIMKNVQENKHIYSKCFR